MIIPFIIAAIVIILDQISKYLIFINKDIILDIVNGNDIIFIKYIFNITYTTNPGASFGILKEHRWVFMTLSSVALVLMAIAIIYLAVKKNHTALQIAIAFMFGGGIGNMIDRIFRGEVVDFIQFAFWQSFPIFNVADSFVCIGSVLFCICIFAGRNDLFGEIKSKDNPENKPESEEI